MWWNAVTCNSIEQRKKLMILFRNNLLQGSLHEVLYFNGFMNIIERCLEQLKLSSLNCLKEQRAIKHDDVPSKELLRAYLCFKYPTKGVNWLKRFLWNSLDGKRCIMTMCHSVLGSECDHIGCKLYCNIV
jgi:hypothetical protein